MSYLPYKEIIHCLQEYYPNADETEKIIINCAAVSAGVDFVGGCIPVLAIPATIISCCGTVWVMYGEICSKLGISIKQNILKVLARAVLAYIAANLGGAIVGVLAGMLVPGSSAFVSAALSFMTIYLAGLVFLQLIVKMVEKSEDIHSFSDISEKEMKNIVKNTKISKEDLEAAKMAYESK